MVELNLKDTSSKDVLLDSPNFESHKVLKKK
jgi:hypothetical protein